MHRFRLRPEDLEDCYSQATLELLAQARGGARFAGRLHIARTLEQRFLSRIHDRRRAVAGRSPIEAALEGAAPLSGLAGEDIDPADARSELEELVLRREELRRITALAQALTSDERLVIASQVGWQLSPGEFQARFGWSAEKYRKVAQRGRARLRRLMLADESASR